MVESAGNLQVISTLLFSLSQETWKPLRSKIPFSPVIFQPSLASFPGDNQTGTILSNPLFCLTEVAEGEDLEKTKVRSNSGKSRGGGVIVEGRQGEKKCKKIEGRVFGGKLAKENKKMEGGR